MGFQQWPIPSKQSAPACACLRCHNLFTLPHPMLYRLHSDKHSVHWLIDWRNAGDEARGSGGQKSPENQTAKAISVQNIGLFNTLTLWGTWRCHEWVQEIRHVQNFECPRNPFCTEHKTLTDSWRHLVKDKLKSVPCLCFTSLKKWCI